MSALVNLNISDSNKLHDALHNIYGVKRIERSHYRLLEVPFLSYCFASFFSNFIRRMFLIYQFFGEGGLADLKLVKEMLYVNTCIKSSTNEKFHKKCCTA